nr:protein kinase-like domain, phloem protein 2-like protein [Tanacetum cinerariifolium]
MSYTCSVDLSVENQVLEDEKVDMQTDLEIMKVSKDRRESIEELKVLLSKGIYHNGYKTWFSLSENGDQSEMISIADCLIPDDSDKYYFSRYESHPLSRFPAGLYKTRGKEFKILEMDCIGLNCINSLATGEVSIL